jgi:tetratricopeptide (TPR) repeat protein
MALSAAILACSFVATNLAAGAAAESGSGQSSFQKQTQDYFSEQALKFAREVLLNEEYLKVLYGGTVEELKSRRKEGLDLNALWSPLWRYEAAHLDIVDAALQETALPERFQAWRDFEEQEFQRRFELIQQVRSQLMSLGTPEQKQRMFKREFMTALRYYGRKDYEFAKLLFNRLIGDYHYQQIDDILYYQGQTCMQLRQFDGALEQFQRLLAACPNSTFRVEAYDQASAILNLFGKNKEIQSLYDDYLNEGAPGNADLAGGIHVRGAQAEAAMTHYAVAAEILERVPENSEYVFAARYLRADCLVALEDWPRATEALIGLSDTKRNGLPYERWRMLLDEAQIKLAYIYYQQSDYPKATLVFEDVAHGSALYDRALMGKAWIAYQLDQYPEAIAKSELLLHRYPFSTEIYEAGSLVGYCYEQMGDKNAATANFLEVLQAGVGRSDLQTFLEERRLISETMAAMKALEEQVFSSGDPQRFADYKRTRDLLWICEQRIGLAEMLQINSKMSSLIRERAALHALLREHKGLQNEVTDSQRGKLMADFRQIEDRILTSLGRLKDLAQGQLVQTPLYFQEAQVAYLNARADSLSEHLEKEIGRLADVIRETDSLKSNALQDGNVKTALDMGLHLKGLNHSLDQTCAGRTRAEAYQHPIPQTRVDYWSDFSFCRYAMDGLDTEELERKWERLRQVEEYLAALDELLEQRGIGEPAPEAPSQP